MLGRDQLPYVLAGMVLMATQPLLVTLSQNEHGTLDYNPVSSTLFTEMLKIIISSSFLVSGGHHTSVVFDPKELVQYSIPAIIYSVNNNLVFVILQYMNPTTFQLLSQLKTVFTGLLFRIFLGRTLTKYQYLAIWQLTCGTATSHIPLCVTATVGVAAATSTSASIGFMMSVGSCLLSAMGGIYSEKLLKKNASSSIHWQNIQLYGWGCFFNLLGAIVTDPESVYNPFKGFNFWAFAVVLNNALNGLAISAILKYADNIARVYAHAAAMMVTMLISVSLFGQSITPQIAIAVAMVGASAVQYNLKDTPTPQLPQLANTYAPVKKTEPEAGVVGTELADRGSLETGDEHAKS